MPFGVRRRDLAQQQAPALYEIYLHLFGSDTRPSAARFGDQAIPEVRKPNTVFFQVDENRDLAAFTIGDELNASHSLIVPHRAIFHLPSQDRQGAVCNHWHIHGRRKKGGHTRRGTSN